MTDQKLTMELIKEWAYGDTVIELYESDEAGDSESFDAAVNALVGVKGLLAFAADPACLARSYFVNLLVRRFLWMFRRGSELPFHFSRFLGIMSRDDYRRMNMEREGELYEICLVLDSMRHINDPAIQSLYKQILDFRHDRTSNDSKFYYECWAKLDLGLFESK
ncbi:hypothetical protein KRR23_27390 [Pseudomonas sp. CVAP|uniref:hypothetical protein n=1 Tax=Pseudomonas sp. CVAP\|nr:hypothetical protein [Pseudomonas sp. CVAP\